MTDVFVTVTDEEVKENDEHVTFSEEKCSVPEEEHPRIEENGEEQREKESEQEEIAPMNEEFEEETDEEDKVPEEIEQGFTGLERLPMNRGTIVDEFDQLYARPLFPEESSIRADEPHASRHTIVVLLRSSLVLVALGLAGCQVTRGCPDLEKCVSSQTEAERLNAGLTCGEYVYCPSSDGGSADSTVTVEDAGSFPGFDGEQPEAPEFIDAGCVEGGLPPGLGARFSCGDASCWSGSEYCSLDVLGDGGVCAPLPCRCGAAPACGCLFACPFESCVQQDAGGLYQRCSCP